MYSMLIIICYTVYLKFARVNLKCSHHTQKKMLIMYVNQLDWVMILQYIHITNHHIKHLKYIHHCICQLYPNKSGGKMIKWDTIQDA